MKHWQAAARAFAGGFMEQRLTPGRILLSITCVIAVRTLLEVFSRRHTLALTDDFYRVIVFYLHPYLSWLCVLAALALLIGFFLKLPYRESISFTLLFSPLIMIVPLVDTVVGGGVAGAVKYGETFDTFFHDFTRLFDPFASIGMVTAGVRLEVFLVVAGSLVFGLFVFRRGFWRSCGLALSIYTVIFLFGYLPALYSLAGWGLDDIHARAVTGLSPEQLLFSFYLLPSVVIAGLTCGMLARERTGLRASSLVIPATGVVPVLLAVAGFFSAVARSEMTSEIMNPGDLFKPAALVLSLYLLFLDRALRARGHAGGTSAVLVTLSLVFGAAAEGRVILFWALIAGVIVLYDHPPFTLRRVPIIRALGDPLIALAALLSGAALVMPLAPSLAFTDVGPWVFVAATALSLGVGRLTAQPIGNPGSREKITKEE